MERVPDELDKGWAAFCESLKRLGDFPDAAPAPQNMLDRTAGYRLLARNIPLALQFSYENCDPLNPELMRFFDPLRKQSGDNSDGLYIHAPINGTDTYRVSGHIGSADYVSFVVCDHGPSPWGGAVTAMISGDDLEIDADGQFSLGIGPDSKPGNWLQTNGKTYRVLIRQFFADWESEKPMVARIDRVSGGPAPPVLSAAGLIKGWEDAAIWLDASIRFFQDLIEKWRKRRNEFLSWPQLEGRMGNTPGGVALTCYWELPADEALIIRVRPPDARYWSVELGNYWWETIDYRYHLNGTNKYYAALEEDGELIVVVAHDDPGVANWTSTTGFSAGYATYRWMGTDDQPVPIAAQVKRNDLFAHLPKAVRTVSPSQRQEQIAQRRRGALQRFQL